MSNMIGNLLFIAFNVLVLYIIELGIFFTAPFVPDGTFSSYEPIILGILKVLVSTVALLGVIWLWVNK